MIELSLPHEHPNIKTQEQLDDLKKTLTTDLRRLNYYSKLRMLDYEDSRFHKHLGQPYCLPKDLYMQIDTLKECLFERGFLNILICDRNYLYEKLKIDGSKPYRTLKYHLDKLESRMFVRWEEVDRTHLKILINPQYGFVYTKSPRRNPEGTPLYNDQMTSFYTAYYTRLENYYWSFYRDINVL